ncbi:MAG TPA: hypothetical protein VFO89_04610, partial [Thermoanaerobaculia bacterium]|nr:hypothetical protein [Thermoanaerobaculia bacterium]
MINRSRLFKFVVALTVMAMPFAAFGIGKPAGGGNSIEWQLDVSGHEAIEITVVSPSGDVYTSTARGGQN